MTDRKDVSQEKDPIDALEESVRMRLQNATDEDERKHLERMLATCNDLRWLRTVNQEMENAPPEEKAYWAFLNELDQIKKQRAAGQIASEEALYLIARFILPRAVASTETSLRTVAPSLWPLVERAQQLEPISDEEHFYVEEFHNNIQKLVASEFLLHGERELADLYKNDLKEFFRQYERGKELAARSAGPI